MIFMLDKPHALPQIGPNVEVHEEGHNLALYHSEYQLVTVRASLLSHISYPFTLKYGSNEKISEE